MIYFKTQACYVDRMERIRAFDTYAKAAHDRRLHNAEARSRMDRVDPVYWRLVVFNPVDGSQHVVASNRKTERELLQLLDVIKLAVKAEGE